MINLDRVLLVTSTDLEGLRRTPPNFQFSDMSILLLTGDWLRLPLNQVFSHQRNYGWAGLVQKYPDLFSFISSFSFPVISNIFLEFLFVFQTDPLCSLAVFLSHSPPGSGC